MAGEIPLAGGTSTAPVTSPPSTAPGGAPSLQPPVVAPPVVPPAGASNDWLAPFSPELRGKIETKGLKSLADLGNSWDHSQSLVGKVTGADPSRVIVLPKEDPDGSARRAALVKFGVPETADGYGFKPTDPKADASFANKTAEIAHKYAIPQREAVGFVTEMTQYIEGVAKTQTDAALAVKAAAMKADIAALEQEYGAAYPDKVAFLKNVTNKLIPETFEGKSRKDIVMGLESVFGVKGFAKWMDSMSGMFGEIRFIEGAKPTANPTLTVEGQHQKLTELKNTPGFAMRLAAGEAEATRMWNEAMPKG